MITELEKGKKGKEFYIKMEIYQRQMTSILIEMPPCFTPKQGVCFLCHVPEKP
jgi:hypothetical protein